MLSMWKSISYINIDENKTKAGGSENEENYIRRTGEDFRSQKF